MQTIKLQPLSESNEHDLGIPVNPQTIGAGVGIGKKLFGGIKGLFGGGSKGPSKAECRQREQKMTNIFANLFTASERQELCQILENIEDCLGPDPTSLALEYIGGKDCIQPSSKASKKPWIKIVDDRIREKRQQQEQRQQQQRNNNLPARTTNTNAPAQAGFLPNVSTPVKVGAAVVLTGLVFANRKQIGKTIS